MPTLAERQRSIREQYKQLENKALHSLFGQFSPGEHTTWSVRGILTQLQKDVPNLDDKVKEEARDGLTEALDLRRQLMRLYPSGTRSADKHQFFMTIESQMIHILDINIAPPVPQEAATETSQLVEDMTKSLPEEDTWAFGELEVHLQELSIWRHRIKDLFQRAIDDPYFLSVADFASRFALQRMCDGANSLTQMYPDHFEEDGKIKPEDFRMARARAAEQLSSGGDDEETTTADTSESSNTGPRTFPELVHFLTSHWSAFEYTAFRKVSLNRAVRVPYRGRIMGDQFYEIGSWCLLCYALKLPESWEAGDTDHWELEEQDLEMLCLAAVYVDTMLPLSADPELLQKMKANTIGRLAELTREYLLFRKYMRGTIADGGDYFNLQPRITFTSILIMRKESVSDMAIVHTWIAMARREMNGWALMKKTYQAMVHVYLAYVLLGIEHELPEDVRERARAFVPRYEKLLFRSGHRPTDQATWKESLRYLSSESSTETQNRIRRCSFVYMAALKREYREADGINTTPGTDEWWQQIQDKAAEELHMPCLVTHMDQVETDYPRHILPNLLNRLYLYDWESSEFQVKTLLRTVTLKTTYFPDV
ncbi:hypothetical protein F5Y17DRAFT_476811 [Xylariaceae sp. FL0594]|nr:hypothetical protein F5Y17DRAFT_476811 [Xylariaceae sp. FL0594]